MANAQALIVLAGQVGISPFRGRQIIQYGARSVHGRMSSKRNGADATHWINRRARMAGSLQT